MRKGGSSCGSAGTYSHTIPYIDSACCSHMTNQSLLAPLQDSLQVLCLFSGLLWLFERYQAAPPFGLCPEEPVDVLPLEDDELLDPHFTPPNMLHSYIQPLVLLTADGINVGPLSSNVASYTGPLSSISEANLNDLIIIFGMWELPC